MGGSSWQDPQPELPHRCEDTSSQSLRHIHLPLLHIQRTLRFGVLYFFKLLDVRQIPSYFSIKRNPGIHPTKIVNRRKFHGPQFHISVSGPALSPFSFRDNIGYSHLCFLIQASSIWWTCLLISKLLHSVTKVHKQVLFF